MKQSKRILAYSALALLVMLAAFGAITFDTSNVAYAQGTGTVPAAPSLTASASGANSIDLTWNAVDDAESYELWAWDSEDQWQRLDGGESDPLTGTSFTHSDLTDGRTYYYQIRAINGEGGMSAWSARVNEVAGDAPDRPVLTATAGYEQITVSWAEVTGAARYELWAWDGAWEQLDGGAAVPLSATTHTQTGLTAGRTTYYQARAVNAGGVMSAWSAQVSDTVLSTPTTSAPQTLAAASGNGEVTLTWTAPASDGGLGIDGYHHRYGETGGTTGAWTGAGDVLTVTISSLTNGTGYTFEVRAFNSGGNGPEATVSASPTGAPGAPGALSASPTSDSVTYTWAAAVPNGAPVTRYEYLHYESGGTVPTTWTPIGDVLTVTISSLTKGTIYTFNVRAVNSVGEGAVATKDETPSGKPGAPQNLTATGGPGNIALSWDAPADDGGSSIVNYRIEKYDAATTNWGFLVTRSGTTYKYTDGSVTIGATTNYRVRAFNANTNDPSDWAAVSGIAQGRAVPGKPTKLTATSGEGSITYTWEAPASNGGTAITEYEYKHFLSDVAESEEPDSWTSNSLRTGVSFPTLESDETYDFQVRAVNAVGAGDWEVEEDTPAATTPSLPRRFTAEADNNDPEIELNWDDPLEKGGSILTGYHLQVKEGSDGDWTDVATFERSDTLTDDEITLVELTFGVTYYYRIRALNVFSTLTEIDSERTKEHDKMLDELDWVEANDTVASSWPARVGALEVEGVADDVTTSFEDGRIKVTWAKPLDHGQPITSYRLRWLTTGQETFPAANVVEVQAPALEYIMIGPDAADDYQFQVLAVNSLTEDDEIDNTVAGAVVDDDDFPIKWSASSEILDVPVVSPVDTVGDDTLNGLDVDAASDGRATITWRMEPDEVGTTVQYTVASYDLEWIDLGIQEGAVTLPNAVPADGWDDAESVNLAAQALMQRIVGPLPGNTNLFVRVRVVTTVGTKSLWTPAALEPIDARAPDHPELTATIIGQNVILTWDKPESNGSPILRYELQFKKDDGDFGDGNDGILPDGTGTADEDDVITFGRRADPAVADSADNILDPVTTHPHENLDGGATYTYRIRTVTLCNDEDANDCGSAAAVTGPDRKWSAEVVATSDAGPPAEPVLPGIPALSADAKDADGLIELSWTKPSGDSSPITGYQIQRWNGSAWVMLPTSLGAEDDEYNDTTAELGKTYHYAIRAVSLAGAGAWTQHTFPPATLDAKKPDKIDDLLATADGQTITLTWTAPAANGTPITGYELEFTDDPALNDEGGTNTRSWDDIEPVGPVLATSRMQTMRTPGKTYYYRIRAVNLCNDSAAGDVICGGPNVDEVTPDADKVWSSEESVAAEAMAPNAPTGVTAAAGTTFLTLAWTLPGPDPDKGAFNENEEVHGTGGAVITGVEVERWNISTVQWDPIETVEVTLAEGGQSYSAGTGTMAYIDRELEDGTLYTYRVRAVNSAGASGWTTMFTGTTNAAAPDLPMLRARAEGQNVVLSWNTPDDNGASIMRYEIQRFPSIDDVGNVENDWGDDLEVGDGRDGVPQNDDDENNDDEEANDDVIVPMPVGVITYTDMGLMPGTTYYYRIRAVNSQNSVLNDDARIWSTEVQVPTAPKAPDKMTLMFGDITQTEITLTWDAPKNNGSPISEYQIERWSSPSWQLIKDELPVSVTKYEETGLEAGTRYFYRIRAVNAGGEGAWSTLTYAVTDAADE